MVCKLCQGNVKTYKDLPTTVFRGVTSCPGRNFFFLANTKEHITHTATINITPNTIPITVPVVNVSRLEETKTNYLNGYHPYYKGIKHQPLRKIVMVSAVYISTRERKYTKFLKFSLQTRILLVH